MAGEIVRSIEQVTPDWFTTALSRSGALVEGSVTDVEVEILERELSTIARLELRYAAGSAGELPPRLLLKLVDTDPESQRPQGGGFDTVKVPAEVNYYVRDYVGVDRAPVLRCYDAAYSIESGRYHILMLDCSTTHATARNRTPTLEYGLALAESLAVLHSHWWGTERLNIGGEPIPSSEAITRYMAPAMKGLNPMLEICGPELGSTWRDAIIDLFENHPEKMVERTLYGEGFTLVHGDVNPGNILAPISGDGLICLIDRAPFDWSLTTWLGVSDISCMMVHWWEPETRRQLEQPILKHYHENLVRNGVAGYSWDQLLEDYRLCAVQSVYVATEWCRGVEARVKHKSIWLPMLRRSMVAFYDLKCDQIWR